MVGCDGEMVGKTSECSVVIDPVLVARGGRCCRVTPGGGYA